MIDVITWDADGRVAKIEGVALEGRIVRRWNSGDPFLHALIDDHEGSRLEQFNCGDNMRVARWVVEGALREHAERLRKAGAK